ncbi:MAG: hypothetical protein V4500_12815 [Pseudomonadota bacterium]
MSITVIILAMLVFALVALNIYATLHMARSGSFGLGQKIAQVFLIWLLPLVGPLLVLRVINEEPWHHEEHFEQIEHSDRVGINGESTPWSGLH